MTVNKTTLIVDDQQHATILAALRWYQQCGMGEPDNRPEAIHDIATNAYETTSLDAEGIDTLCMLINMTGGE
jgi:hypothetical protein